MGVNKICFYSSPVFHSPDVFDWLVAGFLLLSGGVTAHLAINRNVGPVCNQRLFCLPALVGHSPRAVCWH